MMRFAATSSRIRKRTFVVTGLTLLAVALVGCLVALYAVTTLGPAELNRFSLEDGQNRSVITGGGISLNEAESANLLRDTSFEPLVFRQSLTIYSGDATTLTVSSEEASGGLYGDGFFDQASARVMTQTTDGLVLKKNAHVLHFGINRVGVFQPVSLPGDVPDGLALLSFARNEDMTLAVGEQGLIVRNVTGQTPEIVESGLTADLTGICANSGGFLVCSAAGDLLQSENGQKWTQISSFNQSPLRAVAQSDQQLAVAVGDRGTLVVCQDSRATVLNKLSQADLTDVAWGLNTFVAVGRSGTILVSQTGLLWREIDLNTQVNWLTVDFRDGRFTLAGDQGAVAVSDDGILFQMLQQDRRTTYVDVVMLSKQQMILLSDDGNFYITNDSGNTWLQSSIETGMHSRIIALAGKDKILSADENGSLGIAQLVAEIQLDSPLKEGQYQAGDLLFLEKSSATVPDAYLAAATGQTDSGDPWTLWGSGLSRRAVGEASPGGGTASLLLQATGGDDHPAILSQQLDTERLQSFRQNEILQVELWMKQSDIADRQVQVWLSGPFTSVGTTFDNVGTAWKKYSFTIILPAEGASLQNQEVRLNFAINSGSLWIDRVFFGSAKETSNLFSQDQQKLVASIQPQIIRLNFLGLGSSSVQTESWALPLGNDTPTLDQGKWVTQTGSSLHAAMELTLGSGADPWLVVDSYTSEAELLNLIEYLAGPISEPYGKLRQELGSVIPWTEQFDRIFIEICDNGQVFQDDDLKSDFVDLMIHTISQSPYYRQIKSQLIFIDGMAYQDGVMLSSADYHASDLSGLLLNDSRLAIDTAYQNYFDLIPRNPEKSGQNWPELIRSASLRVSGTHQATLADYVQLCLQDLGQQSGLANLLLPGKSNIDWQAALPSAAHITSLCAQGYPLKITRITAEQSTDSTSDETEPGAAASDDKIQAFGFRTDRQITVALTNASEQVATCQLSTDLPLQNATLEKYDAAGTLLDRQTLKRNDSKITVLPGGTILLIKNIGD
ncbi:MAG: hypothetical protein VB070_04745 [Clostridiaceae bacterium]|nr:hypothetical protein [Clostridiaceae bacterium]